MTEGPPRPRQVDSGRVTISTNLLVLESESELYHYQARNLAVDGLSLTNVRRFSLTTATTTFGGMNVSSILIEDEGVLPPLL